MLAVLAGLCPGEISALQWKHARLAAARKPGSFPQRLYELLCKRITAEGVIQAQGSGIGLGIFHVMRRTHSSLMRELDADPKVVAEQLGHTLDVNLNVCTEAGFKLPKKAVNTLESALESLNGVEMEYVN